MLSLSNIKSASGAVDYFFKYYASDTSLSQWSGRGAEVLDLKGEVEQESFRRILEGHITEDVKLGIKKGDEIVHAPGIDMTFSAPKGVSILAELYGKQEVKDAHHRAVQKAIAYIEENYTYTRITKDGDKSLERVKGAIMSTFVHETSRANDPHLHTHVILANAVLCEDNTWRTGYFKEIFKNKKYLGMVYRSELAYELKHLGYHIEKTHSDGRFDVLEIPKEVRMAFSTRREAIEEALTEYAYVNAKTASIATLATREAKEEIPKEELIEKWSSKIKELEFDLDEHSAKVIKSANSIDGDLKQQKFNNSSFLERLVIMGSDKLKSLGLIKDATEVPKVELSEEEVRKIRFERAANHLSEKVDVFTKEDLLNAASVSSLGEVRHEDFKNNLNKFIKRSDKVLDSNNPTFIGSFTTSKALKLEQEMIQIMKDGAKSMQAVCSAAFIDEFAKDSTLNRGQIAAIKMILNNKDLVAGIQGNPGTGKTFMMKNCRLIAEKFGYNIIGLAPSASAAATLEEASGIKSKTISKFLADINRGDFIENPEKTIIVVDEASLCSTKQIHKLSRIASTFNIRLRECGDAKQLNSPEAGKPFEEQQRAGMSVALMDNIIRQKDAALKSAVYAALEGNIRSAIKRIDESVFETDDHTILAKEWLALDQKQRNSTIVMVPQKDVRDNLNTLIRDGLKKEGAITGSVLEIKIFDKKDLSKVALKEANNYKEGDVVVFNQAIKSLKINKGDELVVRASLGDKVVELESEKGRVLFEPTNLRNASLIDVYTSQKMKIQKGDKVRWTKNSSSDKGIINATAAEVLEVAEKHVSFKLQNGQIKNLSLDAKELRHMNYAYANTVHFAQGRTNEEALGFLSANHTHLTNQKIFNVMISRPEYKIKLYTDDKEKLIKTLEERSGIRISALEHQEHVKHIEQKPSITENMQKIRLEKVYDRIDLAEVYHNLYHRLPSLLPEFGFKSSNGKLVSTTAQRIDGSFGKSKGKVYVYQNNPGFLKDYSREAISIWEYVARNKVLSSEKKDVFEYLKTEAGLGDRTKEIAIKPISQPVSNQAQEKPQVDHKLLNAIMVFTQKSLINSNNEILRYLIRERKYSKEDIKRMGLGLLDGKRELGKFLNREGFSDEKIKEAYSLLHVIGKSHKMIIPFKDENGNVIGLGARNIHHCANSRLGKYMYTKGLFRGETLFNAHALEKDKEAVLVEGMLDCLHASSKGIKNVVALGGTACNERQLRQLESKGIDKVVLCLDNDNAGLEATKKVLDTASKFNLNIKFSKATMPSNIKDPDQMLCEKGVKAFESMIKEAHPVALEKHPESLVKNMSARPQNTFQKPFSNANIKHIDNDLCG